jgi:hypothetical protein
MVMDDGSKQLGSGQIGGKQINRIDSDVHHDMHAVRNAPSLRRLIESAGDYHDGKAARHDGRWSSFAEDAAGDFLMTLARPDRFEQE